MIEFSTNNSTDGDGVKGRGVSYFTFYVARFSRIIILVINAQLLNLMLKLSVREFNKVKLVSIYQKRRIMVAVLTNIKHFILY